MRGASIGELQLPDMQHGNGQPLFDGQGNLQPLLRGESFSVKPYGLKNRQQANAGSISCIVPGERTARNVHHATITLLLNVVPMHQHHANMNPIDARRA